MKFLGIFTLAIISLVLNVNLYGTITVNAKLQEKFSWKQLSFEWPNSESEQEAFKLGHYKAEHNLPLGVERWQNKLFITVPRWKSGVAATLNYVDLNSIEKSPKLIPYPSWEHNTPYNKLQNNGTKQMDTQYELMSNSSIISTFRIQVDVCNRLWVLDTGLIDILGNPKQVAPNAIIVFDLKTDTLIRRFPIPAEHVKEDSFFANIIVDTEAEACDDAFAYIPDLGTYTVIVYSLRNNHAFRVKHNFFHFDPLHGNFDVDGVNFQWTDGVFGMAIGPKKSDLSRDIYFHALASTKEFRVNNRVLQNESFVTSSDAYYDFHLVGERGMNGQATTETYDNATDVIFYTQVNKDAIGCWNIKKPYVPETQGLVDSDSHTLIFPNDLKLDSEGNLWVLSDRMPTFLFKDLNANDINYRVMTGKNTELIKGTPCSL